MKPHANIDTIILDQSQAALDTSLVKINKYYQDRIKKSKLTVSQADSFLNYLRSTSNYQDIADVDLVIEAAYEDLELKKTIFRKLDLVTNKETILATNTSTLDINQIASCVSQPERVVGLHFFSPANIMKLLEIVRTQSTSDAVIASSFSLAKKIGKVPVLSNICDGFIGNRMLEHYGRMARILVEEGAMPWEVDKALEEWGMGMGPFKVFDLVGNDIAWAVRKRRYIEKPHIRYGKVADEICLLGRFGQKTNAGWYRYDIGSRNPIPDIEVEKIIISYRKEHGINSRQFSPEEIVKRCIFALINEGARILEEGIALRASDIDVVYLTGYGFPQFRGGPMKYADEIGLHHVVKELNALYQDSGDPFWKPAKLLEDYAIAGKSLNA
jgi:3-hydroxyacyl-CoA dehydrogenase